MNWIFALVAIVLAPSVAAQGPVLQYDFEGVPGDGWTLNTGSVNPGLHPLVGHEENCSTPGVGNGGLGGSGLPSAGVSTGFDPSSLGAGSWTIGFCILTQANPNPPVNQYLFGSTGSLLRIYRVGGPNTGGNAIWLQAQGGLSSVFGHNIGQAGFDHIVFVLDRATSLISWYRNGERAALLFIPNSFQGLFAPGVATIGSFAGSTSTMAAGDCLDAFRLYPRALSPTEIRDWYNACLPCRYQTNSTAASLDVNGLFNYVDRPLIARYCAGQTVTINLGGTPGRPWELASTVGIDAHPDVLSLLAPNKLNIDLFHPSISFLNNGSLPPLVPTSFQAQTPPLKIASQMAVVDPSVPAGLTLSAPLVWSGAQDPNAVILGPPGDNSFIAVYLTAPPICAGPANFYGQTWDAIHVVSNGRITFPAGDEWHVPTPTLATDSTMIGLWSDFNPAMGAGTPITIDHQVPGVVSIWYKDIPVFGGGTLADFQIEYLVATSEWLIRLNAINGPSTQMAFRGASAGGTFGPTYVTATNPGPQVFLPGSSGIGTQTGMIYDFLPLNQLSLGTLRLTPKPGFPIGFQGYDWSFF